MTVIVKTTFHNYKKLLLTSINVESHVLPLLLRNLEGNHHNHVLLLSLLCNLEGTCNCHNHVLLLSLLHNLEGN